MVSANIYFPRISSVTKMVQKKKKHKEGISNPTKAKAFFLLISIHLLDVVRAMRLGQTQSNIWAEQEGSFFYSINKINRLRLQKSWGLKRLLFLSPYHPACSPPFSLQHSVPIHLFRVWLKSSWDLEESCYIVWNSPEFFLVFIISSFNSLVAISGFMKVTEPLI